MTKDWAAAAGEVAAVAAVAGSAAAVVGVVADSVGAEEAVVSAAAHPAEDFRVRGVLRHGPAAGVEGLPIGVAAAPIAGRHSVLLAARAREAVASPGADQDSSRERDHPLAEARVPDWVSDSDHRSGREVRDPASANCPRQVAAARGPALDSPTEWVLESAAELAPRNDLD